MRGRALDLRRGGGSEGRMPAVSSGHYDSRSRRSATSELQPGDTPDAAAPVPTGPAGEAPGSAAAESGAGAAELPAAASETTSGPTATTGAAATTSPTATTGATGPTNPTAPADSRAGDPEAGAPSGAPSDAGAHADAGKAAAGDAAPGLFGQLKATIEAVRRLVTSHVDLAKAELGEIWDHAKRALALAAGAIAIAIYLAILVSVGGALFLGDWIFGSIGWGLAHGTLFCIAMIVTLALAALEVPTWHLGRAYLVGAGLAIVIAVILGYGWAHQGWERLGDSVLAGVDAGSRPLAAALLGGAVVLGVLGLLLGTRGGGAGAIGGLVAGAVLGALVGAITAISYPLNAGAGLGVCVGLIAWPAIEALDLRGFDFEALKSRYWPSATIDTTKETIEWVRERTPLGRKP